MKALGIVLAVDNTTGMRELSDIRAICAMPVGGSFRSIDFVLSNMTNSHVQRVAVMTQYNSRSLNEHLSSSKWWNFGRKSGGLFLFTPTITAKNSHWYRGTADAMAQNIDFLRRSHEPYVVIARGDCIYKLDYNDVIDFHSESGADITAVVKEMPEGEDLARFKCVSVDDSGRITSFSSDGRTIAAGVYVMRRRFLIELLEKCISDEKYDFVSDVLSALVGTKKIMAYRMSGYWSNIADVGAYYKTNMDLLEAELGKYFFRTEPYIYSKVDDLAPAKYNSGCHVRGAIVTSGCIINGTVENSVLFKKVFVGEGCVIRNSIVLNDVYIGENSVIENCIVESRGTISPGSCYRGEGAIKIVNEKNERYVI